MATEQRDWSTALMPAPGWIGAFEQMVRLPFQVFSFGMDVFNQALRAVQPIDGGGPASGSTSNPSSANAGSPNPVSPQTVDPDESKPTPPGTPTAAAPNKPKETVMSCCDTNLSDDMLKLVQYSIVCIERGHEEVLLCNACKIFSDNMTDCDFDSWVIADFVQHNEIPCKKKSLRVSFQVLGRWPQQDLNYEEKELRRLAGIEHAIRGLKPHEEGGQIAAAGS